MQLHADVKLVWCTPHTKHIRKLWSVCFVLLILLDLTLQALCDYLH